MSHIKKIRTNPKSFLISLIFLVLIIFNVVLFASLIRFYFMAGFFKSSVEMFGQLFTMISAIIILGFISTRLPQLRNMGDNSLYEIGYLIIIGLLSIIISYFNKSTNSDAFVDPFVRMFEVLSVELILMLVMSKTSFFKNVKNGVANKKDTFICFIMFLITSLIATTYVVQVDDAYSNVRNFVVMISGLFGGPVVGIPIAIISAVYRFLMGGSTAFPCSMSTVICGFMSSAIYVLNKKKFLKGYRAALLIFLFVGFEMLMIVWVTPESISIPYINDLYPLMVFGNVLGMILFLMIIREQEKPKEIDYEVLRIKELENTVEEYQDKIDKLEEDVEILKRINDLD